MKTFLTICFISVFCLAGWGQNRDDEPDTPEGLMTCCCPAILDSDGDGYPDTEDDEVNSPKGSAVNRNGVAYWSIRDCEMAKIANPYGIDLCRSNDELMQLALEKDYWDWTRNLFPQRAMEFKYQTIFENDAMEILHIFYCEGKGEFIDMKVVARNYEEAVGLKKALQQKMVEILGIESEQFMISMDIDSSMPTSACYFIY